jgi:hypothetical protein
VDRLAIDARTLLVAARAVGLAVAADGDRVRVHGPKTAAGLARLLIEHKAAVLPLLLAESNPAGPPQDPLDLVVAHIASRRGAAVVAVEGGRVIEPGPAVPAAPVPEAAAPGPRPWPPRPAELAEWPVEWRAKWGVRANELQDQGIPWPEHERRAFLEVQAEMTGPPPDPEQHRRIRERFATWVEDEYAREERASILEFDGGLSREAAEIAAGLRRPRYEDVDWRAAPDPHPY